MRPLSTRVAQIVYRNLNESTGVTGTSPGMLTVRDWSLAAGRSMTDDDVKSATKVAPFSDKRLLTTFLEALTPSTRLIRIKKIPFRVIGVWWKRGNR